jgi:hypothetical protein
MEQSNCHGHLCRSSDLHWWLDGHAVAGFAGIVELPDDEHDVATMDSGSHGGVVSDYTGYSRYRATAASKAHGMAHVSRRHAVPLAVAMEVD